MGGNSGGTGADVVIHQHRRRMTLRQALAWPVLALLATACAHQGPPAAYPGFALATAESSLVVAQFVSTGDLPGFPECQSRDVVCMDPAPTWIKLRSLESIYGKPVERRFFASTTSHYGRINAHGGVDKPMLMLLHSQAGAHVMARYARASLDADSQGRRHLVLTHPGPYWLPCSTRGLREAISDATLARASRMPRAQYQQYHAEHDAGFFRVEGEFAYPRYSLPMARLQAHLRDKALAPADFACSGTTD